MFKSNQHKIKKYFKQTNCFIHWKYKKKILTYQFYKTVAQIISWNNFEEKPTFSLSVRKK